MIGCAGCLNRGCFGCLVLVACALGAALVAYAMWTGVV